MADGVSGDVASLGAHSIPVDVPLFHIKFHFIRNSGGDQAKKIYPTTFNNLKPISLLRHHHHDHYQIMVYFLCEL